MTTVGEKLTRLADAIRRKAGGTEKLSLDQMVEKVDSIESLEGHVQSADTITAGTLAGEVVANAEAVADIGRPQVRNIYITNESLDAGVSNLNAGDICIIYE